MSEDENALKRDQLVQELLGKASVVVNKHLGTNLNEDTIRTHTIGKMITAIDHIARGTDDLAHAEMDRYTQGLTELLSSPKLYPAFIKEIVPLLRQLTPKEEVKDLGMTPENTEGNKVSLLWQLKDTGRFALIEQAIGISSGRIGLAIAEQHDQDKKVTEGRIARKDANLNRLTGELNKTKEELGLVNQDKEALKSEIVQQKANGTELQANLLQVQEELKSANKDKEALKSEQELRNIEVMSLQEKVTKLTQEIQQQKQELAQKDIQITTQQEQITELTKKPDLTIESGSGLSVAGKKPDLTIATEQTSTLNIQQKNTKEVEHKNDPNKDIHKATVRQVRKIIRKSYGEHVDDKLHKVISAASRGIESATEKGVEKYQKALTTMLKDERVSPVAEEVIKVFSGLAENMTPELVDRIKTASDKALEASELTSPDLGKAANKVGAIVGKHMEIDQTLMTTDQTLMAALGKMTLGAYSVTARDANPDSIKNGIEEYKQGLATILERVDHAKLDSLVTDISGSFKELVKHGSPTAVILLNDATSAVVSSIEDKEKIKNLKQESAQNKEALVSTEEKFSSTIIEREQFIQEQMQVKEALNKANEENRILQEKIKEQDRILQEQIAKPQEQITEQQKRIAELEAQLAKLTIKPDLKLDSGMNISVEGKKIEEKAPGLAVQQNISLSVGEKSEQIVEQKVQLDIERGAAQTINGSINLDSTPKNTVGDVDTKIVEKVAEDIKKIVDAYVEPNDTLSTAITQITTGIQLAVEKDADTDSIHAGVGTYIKGLGTILKDPELLSAFADISKALDKLTVGASAEVIDFIKTVTDITVGVMEVAQEPKSTVEQNVEKNAESSQSQTTELKQEQVQSQTLKEQEQTRVQPQKIAEDSFNFEDKESNFIARTSGAINKSDEIDAITKEIREQVISKQFALLQNALSEKAENQEQKTQIEKLNRSEFSQFLQDEKNKDAINKALAEPKLSAELNKIEVAGYKQVHSKFKDQFQALQWETSPVESIRSKEIKNKEGQSLCTLSETMVKTPMTITMANGTEKQVSGYRKIDFPKELQGKGPLHLSMAVKDADGKNIAEDKAVYFSAHYNKEGKLTEVSTPMPVKFMGKGGDAIGYIERDGNIYTLPVTQGKYKEMMKEVARNQGMGTDLSQSINISANDKILQSSQVETTVNLTKVQNITELDYIINGIEKLAINDNFQTAVGKKNAEEFKAQIDQLKEKFTKAPEAQKQQILQENLSEVEKWCKAKQQNTNDYLFWKQAKTAINSELSAINALRAGDQKSYQEHMRQSEQTIQGYLQLVKLLMICVRNLNNLIHQAMRR
ncbi:120 KDa Rickettsia-like surface antigen domain protein [Candidatus Trichorickettsia mobilis]|uniref:Antigenic heat-stable 120 kDa protein n=1 Tax=Candidatus Trichorickettsia mobilis TaxID=1346319 RepID=A0ABZ0UVI5_9RICK|nr:Sca4 family protein [Candidatus Trichorickettsia mobilis]WPY01195.1 120 KDa Rickettsia-like surface antigen domain protein [Candidatus Trichorickettsia mobilis]